MYNSQYYTCEQIDQRLLQGYVDDYNQIHNTELTKAQFLTLLGNSINTVTNLPGNLPNILQQMSSSIVELGTLVGYYVCDTAAATAAKTIQSTDYELTTGGNIRIKMTHANTAASPVTLQIGNAAAKELYYNGEPVSTSNTWDDNEIITVYYDGSHYVCEGKSVTTDKSLTEDGAAADAKTVGDIVGHNEPVTTYNNGTRISSTGASTSGQSYAKTSTRISVRKGDVVHATGAADSNHDFAVIAKKEGTKWIPLAVMTDTEVREYIVTIQQDCEVVISGLNSGEGAVSAYVEKAGTLEDKIMSSVLTDAYTREDILPKDNAALIPVSAGDIIYFNCPVRNNDLVKAYDGNSAFLRVMMRFGNSGTITPFSYTVTDADGIHYMSFLSGTISASGYILRRKPASAVVKNDIYERNYATVNDDGVTPEVTPGSTSSVINNKGLIVADSSNQGGRIYKIDNTEHKYKSVSVVSKSLYENYVIAFYNGEPSEDTFIPIYSKNFGEQDKQFVTINASNADKDVYNYTALVPDDAEYIRICVRVAGTNALQRSYFRLYYNADDVKPVNDIRDNFKDKYDKYLLPFNYQHRTDEFLENDWFSNFKQVDFRCLFYTDLHSNVVNLDRILYLGDYLYDKGMLDCIISGGDNLQQANYDYAWFNKRVGASKVDNLVAVGNHDASTHWQATKALAYTNNIAPVLARVDNIVVPSDSESAYRLYYYKDYGKVRVIVLYTPPQNDNEFADDSQLSWLQTVLTDAKTNSKHVIIVNHHYFNDLYYNVGDNCKYSSIGDWWRSNPNTFTCPFSKGSRVKVVGTSFILPTEFLLAVKEFEDAGGVFICWLTGHGHQDNFFDVNDHETYGYQPMFNSASCSTKYTAWQFVKKRGTDSMDCFNYITVDCTQNLIKILRIGANVDVWGRNVTTLVYNYAEHCIVSNN